MSEGRLTAEPMDVMDEGRMAVAVDPTGAVFGLWQAGQHPGASLVSEPGAVSCTELQTGDLDAAQAFYTAISGYNWQETPGLAVRPVRGAARSARRHLQRHPPTLHDAGYWIDRMPLTMFMSAMAAIRAHAVQESQPQPYAMWSRRVERFTGRTSGGTERC